MSRKIAKSAVGALVTGATIVVSGFAMTAHSAYASCVIGTAGCGGSVVPESHGDVLMLAALAPVGIVAAIVAWRKRRASQN